MNYTFNQERIRDKLYLFFDFSDTILSDGTCAEERDLCFREELLKQATVLLRHLLDSHHIDLVGNQKKRLVGEEGLDTS